MKRHGLYGARSHGPAFGTKCALDSIPEAEAEEEEMVVFTRES